MRLETPAEVRRTLGQMSADPLWKFILMGMDSKAVDAWFNRELARVIEDLSQRQGLQYVCRYIHPGNYDAQELQQDPGDSSTEEPRGNG